MKKRFYLILFTIIAACNNSYSQKAKSNNCVNDTTVVFNYFTQRYESDVFDVGSVYLMSSDSISILRDNIYCIEITDSLQGWRNVYFKNKLLFSYEIQNGIIEGLGYCYYPFTGIVAVQAQFKNERLNGMVFIQDENGKMIECMRFKNGVYKEHLFHFELDNSKKSLKKMSKNRSKNPLRNDEKVVMYRK